MTNYNEEIMSKDTIGFKTYTVRWNMTYHDYLAHLKRLNRLPT
ncbi:MAG TPA: hypothetical protein VEA59_05485 [Patescibacteria group bacterium]|nr:hypothetical protein [Patescibacteria group bacterium]